jgi:hypothetical protein
MAGGTDWAVAVPAIVGAIVGTVAGAIITTYGGHGRERREARSNALANLQKIEVDRRKLPLVEGTYYDLVAFAELGAACMIAGVPRSVIAAYDQICNAGRRFTVPITSGSVGTVSFGAAMASFWLGNEAARLMGDALWHPRLMFLSHWWRVRLLRRKAMVLYGDFWQGALTRVSYQNWLKAERASWTARRAALRAAKSALPGEESSRVS